MVRKRGFLLLRSVAKEEAEDVLDLACLDGLARFACLACDWTYRGLVNNLETSSSYS